MGEGQKQSTREREKESVFLEYLAVVNDRKTNVDMYACCMCDKPCLSVYKGL